MTPARFRELLDRLVAADHVAGGLGALEIDESHAGVPETEQVRLPLPAGAEAVRLQKKAGGASETAGFPFLESTKNADGAFVVVRSDETVALVVIECKQTVTLDELRKAQRQLAASLRRLLALCGALRLSPLSALTAVAFRQDEVAGASSPDLSFSEPAVGGEPDVSLDLRRQWTEGWVYLDDLPVLPLARLELDPAGRREEGLEQLLERVPPGALA